MGRVTNLKEQGLDPLVDPLSGYLKHLPEEVAKELVPEGMWALARLFPGLPTGWVSVRLTFLALAAGLAAWSSNVPVTTGATAGNRDTG